jgi:hypothetical protein
MIGRDSDAAGAIEATTGRSVDIVLTRGLADREPVLAYKIAAEGILLYIRTDLEAF